MAAGSLQTPHSRRALRGAPGTRARLGALLASAYSHSGSQPPQVSVAVRELERDREPIWENVL